MRYIPVITVFLWVGFVAGVIFTTNFFLQTVVKYPAVILITIMLTASFWGLQMRGKKVSALLMAGILFVNLAGLTYGLSQTYSAKSTLSDYHGGEVTPTLVGLLNSIDSINDRTPADKIFYGLQGIPLPFLLVEPAATGLSEDKAGSETLSHQINRWMQIVSAKRELSFHIIEVFFMLVLSVTIFLTLIVYLILCDRPKPELAESNRQSTCRH